MIGTSLEGGNLTSVRLDAAIRYEAAMTCARLDSVPLRGADLTLARLDSTVFGSARRDGAGFCGTSLRGARIDRASFPHPSGCDTAEFYSAGLQHIDLSAFSDLDFTQAFGDATVTLPAGQKAGEGPLAHWSPERLSGTAFETAWRASAAQGGAD